MKQQRNRRRQKQINILHTTVRKRHSQKQLANVGLWTGGIFILTVVLLVVFHYGVGFAADHLLYHNPRFTLRKIEILPEGHFSPRQIRQAADLELGENLWTLDLTDIKKNIEKLAYVSSARVERHYPDKITIRIVERQPVVKIVGINADLGTRETFYLDRDCVVLKPREGEPVPPSMPEVIGLGMGQELQPGGKITEPRLGRALEILDAIDKTTELNTAITIRSIDLSQPLSITMVTTRDLSITFRLDYIDQQMGRLQQIFERFVDRDQKTLHSVDLTPNINVPVTFYE